MIVEIEAEGGRKSGARFQGEGTRQKRETSFEVLALDFCGDFVRLEVSKWDAKSIKNHWHGQQQTIHLRTKSFPTPTNHITNAMTFSTVWRSCCFSEKADWHGFSSVNLD
jgi:hypothetical protein